VAHIGRWDVCGRVTLSGLAAHKALISRLDDSAVFLFKSFQHYSEQLTGLLKEASFLLLLTKATHSCIVTFDLNIQPNQAMSPHCTSVVWLKYTLVWTRERTQAIAMWTATVLAICQQGYQIYQGAQSQKLATWAANNDFYQQCYELDPSVRSIDCNETLVTPMSRPPFASDATALTEDEHDNVIRNLTRRAMASTVGSSEPGRYSSSSIDHHAMCFMPFADKVGAGGSRPIVPQTHIDAYTQRPAVDLPDAESSYPHAWSAEPTSMIASKSTDTNVHVEMVSHIDPTYMLAMIVVTVLMHIGLYLCMRQRRSSRSQRIHGLFSPSTHRVSSPQQVHSLSWPSDPTVLGNEGQHWIDYKTISRSITAADGDHDWAARYYAPGQLAAPPRRPRRRYHYPETLYDVPT
jgi:hypothetical protein